MFVQIIEGRTGNAEEFMRAATRWTDELRPGAIGFLGMTAGVSPDGQAITIARFDSPESAKANSERAEQTAFWNEISVLYDGEPTFIESTDAEEFMGGGNDNAQFVQVMKTAGVDRVKMKELDDQFEAYASARPDLLGSFRVWTAPDSCYEIAYFTNEAEARAGEAQEIPEESAALMGDFSEMMANTTYIDLVNPTIR